MNRLRFALEDAGFLLLLLAAIPVFWVLGGVHWLLQKLDGMAEGQP